MAERPKYRRVVLKMSGESFGSDAAQNIAMDQVSEVARRIASVRETGAQLAVVVGGGNIVRGSRLAPAGVNAIAADMMGMLATVINGLVLRDALEHLQVEARLQTAIAMRPVAEPYVAARCLRHLAKGRVVILAGGTGSPHFTTDTAAALRARELHADVLFKATTVDGVYSDDPKKDAKAKRYDRLTYADVLHNELGVMDATAVTLCREGNIPIIVFNMAVAGNFLRAVLGKPVGTYVGEG